MVDSSAGRSAESSQTVAIVMAMLDSASPDERIEIRNLLHAQLNPPPTALKIRVGLLGFLTDLLGSEGESVGKTRVVDRSRYDAVRPKSAAPSKTLVTKFGSRLKACKAGSSMLADGTPIGPGKPWPTTSRGGHVGSPWTRDQLLGAVRECHEALKLGRPPSTVQYDQWVRLQRLAARAAGVERRLPFAGTIYDHFPQRKAGQTRWQTIVDEALRGG
jgi:hypothetical protein